MTSAHQAQLQAQKAQNEAIHLQVKTQSEIALARVKADLDAKLSVLDAHLKAAIDARETERTYPHGTRQAKDGHHYVEDLKRPGKYLLVVHHGLTIHWCRSTISRILATSRSFRWSTIRSATAA